MALERGVKFEAVRNFRHVGGLQSAGGCILPSGLVFRSGHFAHMTATDIARLRQLAPSLIVDLRGPLERAKLPTPRLELHIAEIVTGPTAQPTGEPPHFQFLTDPDLTRSALRDRMQATYRSFMSDPVLLGTFSAAFDAFLRASGPVVVHCHAGKDRTGLFIGMFLHVLGIAGEDILADYLMSNQQDELDMRFEQTLALARETHGEDVNQETLSFMMKAQEDYLAAAFSEATDLDGDIEGFMSRALGLTEVKRQALRQMYLQS